MKLKKIKNYTKEIDISNCLAALDGIFGFSEGTLDSGNFGGSNISIWVLLIIIG
jgi:hypothetical protein